MSDIKRFLVHNAMFEAGIVPIDIETISYDIGRALKDLSPEDARKYKRKFRKLWRKIAKKDKPQLFCNVKTNPVDSVETREEPGRGKKNMRKMSVYHELIGKKFST